MLRDITHAWRLLARSPTFTIAAVLALALGIGASTAIFSVSYAAILRPLPYPHPEQLVVAYVQEQTDRGLTHTGPSLDEARLWRTERQIFSGVGLMRGQNQTIVDTDEPERVTVQHVSEGCLDLFGVVPVVGRLIAGDDVKIGAPAVVMLGSRYWQRRFGGRQEVIGDTLRLREGPATIIGVVPDTFYPDTALWRPLPATTLARSQQRSASATTYARLRDGLPLEEATRELTGILKASANSKAAAISARLDSFSEWTTSDYRPTLRTLSLAVGFVLLIACVNVAGLLLARGAVRVPEMATRAALGAGRRRLVRQLLTESVVLATLGGMAGLVLTWVFLDLVVSFIPLDLPASAPAVVNLPVLSFAALLSVLTAAFFGVIPAIRLSRLPLNVQLGQSNRRLAGTLSRRGGQVLISVETALAVVLLAGAGLLARSLARAESVDVGFDPKPMLMVSSTPMEQTPQVFAEYYSTFVGLLRTIPGVEAAGAIDLPPLAGGERVTTVRSPGGNAVEMYLRQVLPGYFAANGLVLKAGREFRDEDVRSKASSIVINEQAAREMFGGEPAIGRTFKMVAALHEVIGVVGNVRHDGPLGRIEAETYSLVDTSVAQPLTVVLRVGAQDEIPLDRIRQAALSIGPRVLFEGVQSGSELFNGRIVAPRHRAALFGTLGGLGLVLALLGIGTVTAYAVVQRTKEIGIRVACGARPVDIVGRIVKDAAWPVLIGLIVGLGGATVATRVIARFLFGITPTDPVTFAAAGILLGFAAGVAAWLPARRAALIDPVKALRAE